MGTPQMRSLFWVLALALTTLLAVPAMGSCTAGDAACELCQQRGAGYFADVAANCERYFWCLSTSSGFHMSCPPGLQFDQEGVRCDWPQNVSCGAAAGSPGVGASSPPQAGPAPIQAPSPSQAPPSPASPPPPARPPLGSQALYAGYYRSGSDIAAGTAEESRLARLPSYVNLVILSFMRPDCSYPGGLTWEGTGLQFPSEPAVVRDAIARLRQRNPNTTVLLGVGGDKYRGFGGLNTAAIASFVAEFGLDGVDLGYEAATPGCAAGEDGSELCPSETQYVDVVRALRAALPRPLLLTVATWTVGAHGLGPYASDPASVRSASTGLVEGMLRAAGADLDALLAIGYNAGGEFQPEPFLQAFGALRLLYSGPLLMGMQAVSKVLGQALSRERLSLDDAASLTAAMLARAGQGIALRSLQQPQAAAAKAALGLGEGTSMSLVSQLVCLQLRLGGCEAEVDVEPEVPAEPAEPAPSSAPQGPSPGAPSNPPGDAGYLYAGYYESWSDPWVSSPQESRLANLPSYLNVVILSFMRPDCSYPGGLTWEGTGLQFPSEPAVVRDAIALLRQRNPNTKVLVAVGGATYNAFESLNAGAIASFVQTFGLDGVDLDFEPSNPGCSIGADGHVSCASDSQYIQAVTALRAALPRPLMLTAAAWSVGAFGEGAFAAALPTSAYTGVAVPMLRAVGDMLDAVLVMSYDAGPEYDPRAAYQAYRSYYAGAILLGVQAAPEAWGGHVTSVEEVAGLADYVMSNAGQGMMVWSLQKREAPGTPSVALISQVVCHKLGLGGCGVPLQVW